MKFSEIFKPKSSSARWASHEEVITTFSYRKLTIICVIFLAMTITVTAIVKLPQDKHEKPSAVYQQDSVQHFPPINHYVGRFPLIKETYDNFNIDELNTNLLSDAFLLRYSDTRQNIVEYCSTHVVTTLNAQMNCNAATKVDNSWYQFAELSSRLFKKACSSLSNFSIATILILLLFALVTNLFGLTKAFLRLFNPFAVFKLHHATSTRLKNSMASGTNHGYDNKGV